MWPPAGSGGLQTRHSSLPRAPWSLPSPYLLRSPFPCSPSLLPCPVPAPPSPPPLVIRAAAAGPDPPGSARPLAEPPPPPRLLRRRPPAGAPGAGHKTGQSRRRGTRAAYGPGQRPSARAPPGRSSRPARLGSDSGCPTSPSQHCPGPGPGPLPPYRPRPGPPPTSLLPLLLPPPSRLPSCPVRVMPSLPAPPAPLLLLGLLLLGSRPALGAGPEPLALPIRPEKEPLPIRGATGRWAPRGEAPAGSPTRREARTGPEGTPGAGGSAWRAAWRSGRGPQSASCPGTRGGHTAGAGQRPLAKPIPAGCSFGGKVYALDETWHPDLGEPFGVMRCVLCACEAVSGPNRRGPGPRGWRSAGVLGRTSEWTRSC